MTAAEAAAEVRAAHAELAVGKWEKPIDLVFELAPAVEVIVDRPQDGPFFAPAFAAEAAFNLEPLSVWRYLAAASSPELRSALAWSTSTPPQILELLSHDDNAVVLDGVAYNPSSPPSALNRIVAGGSAAIEHVAENPSAPPATLTMIVRSDGPEIAKLWVAHHPSTTVETLEELRACEASPRATNVAANRLAELGRR